MKKLVIALGVSVLLEACAGGVVRTGAYRDWTAKVTVDGLKPGTVHWYRFVAPDGSKSPIGRTKTLPVGDVARFGLGVFSCSNLPVGLFNAYGHAAARPDLDLWLHTGDYIYEYGPTSIHQGDWAVGRSLEPANEILTIADYRLRYNGDLRHQPHAWHDRRLHHAYHGLRRRLARHLGRRPHSLRAPG